MQPASFSGTRQDAFWSAHTHRGKIRYNLVASATSPTERIKFDFGVDSPPAYDGAADRTSGYDYVNHYKNEGVITNDQRNRYLFDALRFWFDEH